MDGLSARSRRSSCTSDAFAEYPERAIRIIVPYTAGGTVDILARALGERLTAAWKQPVVIENRPGAGGSIGAEAAASATPDGYTLYMSTNSPLTTNVWLQKGLNYDPVRDFAPITVPGENSIVLVTHPSVPATNIKELVAYMKTKKPGELSAGTSGQGTTAHLSLGAVQQARRSRGHPRTLSRRRTEPHRSFGQRSPDDVQRHRPGHAADSRGKLRGLATTGPRRAGIAPDIPTMSEAGLHGLQYRGLGGVRGAGRNVRKTSSSRFTKRCHARSRTTSSASA